MVKTKRVSKKTTAAKASASAPAKKQAAGKGKSNGAAKTDKSKSKTKKVAKKAKGGAATKKPTRTNAEMANDGGVGKTVANGLVLRKDKVMSQNGFNHLCAVLGCPKISTGQKNDCMCQSHHKKFRMDDNEKKRQAKEKAVYDGANSKAFAFLEPANALKIENAAKEDIVRRNDLSAAILSAPSVLSAAVERHADSMKKVRALLRAGDETGARALMQGEAYQRMLGNGAAIDTKLHFGVDLTNDCYVGSTGRPWAAAINPMSMAVATYQKELIAALSADDSLVFYSQEVQNFLTLLKNKGPKGARFFVIGNSNKADFFDLEAAAQKLVACIKFQIIRLQKKK